LHTFQLPSNDQLFYMYCSNESYVFIIRVPTKPANVGHVLSLAIHVTRSYHLISPGKSDPCIIHPNTTRKDCQQVVGYLVKLGFFFVAFSTSVPVL